MSEDHQSLLFIGLSKEYGLTEIFDDQTILAHLGCALSSALNDGYRLGMTKKPALVNIDSLIVKYNVKAHIPDKSINLINNILYKAFLEGYEQARWMIDFEAKCLSEGSKISKDLMSMMKGHAKPEDIVFLNYLTNKKKDDE